MTMYKGLTVFYYVTYVVFIENEPVEKFDVVELVDDDPFPIEELTRWIISYHGYRAFPRTWQRVSRAVADAVDGVKALYENPLLKPDKTQN